MERYVDIKFSEEALSDLRSLDPALPPGDEVMLRVKIEPCAHCGRTIPDNEIGGIDPEGITEDGEVLGTFICSPCMEEGL